MATIEAGAAGLMDSGFLLALWQSPTWLAQSAAWGGGLLLSALLLLWSLRRSLRRLAVRRGSSQGLHARLHADQGGAAAAVDFALTFPVVLIMLFVVVQFMLLLNDALIVHYAAYQGARSARVWLWDFDPRRFLSVDMPQLNNPLTLRNPNSGEVQGQVERAVRFALIPAAPAAGGGRGPIPARALDAAAQVAGANGRAEVLKRKAGYAFDPANSQVSYALATRLDPAKFGVYRLQQGDAWPVKVKVAFRVRLEVPVVRIFGSDAGDGNYYTTIKAEMVLL